MKVQLHFLLLYCLFACSNPGSSTFTNREIAIEKQGKAVQMYTNIVMHGISVDSMQTVLDLLDESIALDTTFLLAYDTKKRFLNEQNRQEEAMAVIELAISRHFDKQKPMGGGLFLIRGIQHDKLNQPELAQLDYHKAIILFNEMFEKDPNSYYESLSAKAILLFLSEGKEISISVLEMLLTKPLNDKERRQVEMMLDMIKNQSRDEFIKNFN